MGIERWETAGTRIGGKILENVGTGLGAELLVKVLEKILKGGL